MFEFHTRWRLHLGVHKLETVWITSLAKRNQKWRLYHLRHWLRPRKRFLSSSSPWSLQKQHATLQFPRYLSQCLQAIFPCRKSFMRLPNYFYQVIHSSNSHACSKYFLWKSLPFSSIMLPLDPWHVCCLKSVCFVHFLKWSKFKRLCTTMIQPWLAELLSLFQSNLAETP